MYGTRFPRHHPRFTYPPAAALVFAALRVPLAALKWLITAASVAALSVTLWLTAADWDTSALPARRAALAAAGLALWLQPVQQTLIFGQVNLILMLIIVTDLRLPGTAWIQGAGVGLAAGFKLNDAASWWRRPG